MHQGFFSPMPRPLTYDPRFPAHPGLLRTSRGFRVSTALLATSSLAQTRAHATPQSPYGGVTVEDILARVNDQIITQSDYDRAMKEMDDEAKQHGATMQQISEAHKDLLRDLIDRSSGSPRARNWASTATPS
jgi:membrane-bound lytic murein transglycosylase B